MSQHQASIRWQRAPNAFDATTFSRNHTATLNGHQSLNVSSSVEFKGDPACADPEQLLISAVASCHMLTFLAIADFQGYYVEQYEDMAVGYLEKNDQGMMAVTRIELAPKVVFGGNKQPDELALGRLHAGAHKNCFIRNSVKAEVRIL